MANYNPHAPFILGEEWVGIRDEDFTLSPATNLIEQGHRFVLNQTRIIRDVRFYIKNFPDGSTPGQAYIAAIYPEGAEDQTGPIRSLIMPCSAASITGGATSTTGSPVLDIADPSESRVVSLPGNTPSTLVCAFPMNSYLAPLSGKRIISVNVLYSAASFGDLNNTSGIIEMTDNTDSVPYGAPYGTSFLSGIVFGISKQELGGINHFWSTSPPYSTTERLPWRYTALVKFDPSSVSPNRIRFATTGTGVDTLRIGYVALEVIYCEEQRLMYGGRIFGSNQGSQIYTYGVNTIPMRALSNVTVDPPLVAGAYTLVISGGDPGMGASVINVPFDSARFPALNSVRQTQQLSGMNGGRVIISEQPGETFKYENYDVLPQLSVHTTGTGAPLNEVHVYGDVVNAPVYGAITATQTINDDLGAPARQYPQVRFYARRFGDTTQPLVLSTTSPTISGSGASITVAQFDALQEIVDGWKEVTLRFAAPPTMGAISGNPGWTFSSTLETVGNRWEVLGVSAPAVSGITGSYLTTVPSGQRLGPATYGATGLGDQSSLSWLSPTVTGVAADPDTDAVLIFSTDMPTVTGVGVIGESLAVTGIGLECNIAQECVPSGIAYNRITWGSISAFGIPATGFGYYELQRFDDEDNAWSTIMLTSSIAVTGFSDYEARIGQRSDYRIRAINVLNFAGQWSATVSRTLTAPGVTPTTNNGVLVFTTNSRQNGTNFLAYTMTWDTDVTEPVTFVESNWQQLQPMFGKDYLTAFRSSERGGEQFSRNLIAQQAAVSGSAIDRSVMSFRDLAWDDVPYICVRTEQGDRWYANIRVPSVQIRRYRRLQVVAVEVTEVTRTPYPVNTAV